MLFQQHLDRYLAGMTPAQRDMASYVASQGEKVAFMTAKQLAAATNQSDAAVIRFAQAAGFAGFPQLREFLRAGLLERVGASGMRQPGWTGDAAELKEATFATHGSLIQETANLNTDEGVTAIADLLIAARKIYVTGHGTTYPIAMYLSMHLNQVLDKSQMFNVEHGDVADRFRSVGKGDVFIGIGYARYLPYTVDLLRLARDSGAAVVAITDRVSSPLARLAQHSLFVARGASSQIWWTQAGTLALADWLTALITVRDRATVTKNLRRSDEELERMGFWSAGSEARTSGPTLEEQLQQGASHEAQRSS